MSLPAWFHLDDGRRLRNRSSARQEAQRAKQLGGRVQPGSGSSRRAPQDIRTEELYEQLKETSKKSFTLNVEEWIAIRNDAWRDGRDARLVIDFQLHGVRLIIHEER